MSLYVVFTNGRHAREKKKVLDTKTRRFRTNKIYFTSGCKLYREGNQRIPDLLFRTCLSSIIYWFASCGNHKCKVYAQGKKSVKFFASNLRGQYTKKCWKDPRSNRYYTGFLRVIFKKGSKIGLEGTLEG